MALFFWSNSRANSRKSEGLVFDAQSVRFYFDPVSGGDDGETKRPRVSSTSGPAAARILLGLGTAVSGAAATAAASGSTAADGHAAAAAQTISVATASAAAAPTVASGVAAGGASAGDAVAAGASSSRWNWAASLPKGVSTLWEKVLYLALAVRLSQRQCHRIDSVSRKQHINTIRDDSFFSGLALPTLNKPAPGTV